MVLGSSPVTVTTAETLLNQIFVLNNQNKNEEAIEQYVREENITVTWPDDSTYLYQSQQC